MRSSVDPLLTQINFNFVRYHSSGPSWPALDQGIWQTKKTLAICPEEA